MSDLAAYSTGGLADTSGLPSSAQTPIGPSDTPKFTPILVKERWELVNRALMKERRDYWLHLAFFLDEQWLWWDRKRKTIAELPRDPNRVRLTINRIRPNLNTLLSKLMKRQLTFEVLPSSSDDATVAGAKLGERVLESSRVDQNWENDRREELLLTFLGGTAAICLDWDAEAGDQIERDEETGRIVGTGECKLTPLSIAEFGLQPGVQNERDATWWVRATAMPPEQAQEKFNLKKKPAADASASLSPMQQKLLSESGRSPGTDLCLVLTYYERPCPTRPKGAVATVIGDNFVDGPKPWPFPWDDKLNLRLFRQTPVPQRWTGDTLLSSAVPVQVAYNHARSVLAEHMKLAGNARLMVPDAAIDLIDELTDEPGEVVPFNAQAGQPYYLAPPNLPRWVIQEADTLRQELDDIMSVHDVSRGVGGADSSGTALALLAEKDDTPLGMMAWDQSEGWGDIGSMVLECYANKVDETRLARSVGPNKAVSSRKWRGSELRDQTHASVPLDNVLPHSRVALQAWATSLWDRQLVTDPAMFAKLADLPDQESLAEALNADAASAQFENALMADNQPVIPEKFEDHATHIAEHNRWRKSTAYRFAEKEVRDLFDAHIQVHENLAHELLAEQAARAQANPLLPGAPQGNEPPGSVVPPDQVETAAAAQPSAGGAVRAPGGGGSPAGGPPAGGGAQPVPAPTSAAAQADHFNFNTPWPQVNPGLLEQGRRWGNRGQQ